MGTASSEGTMRINAAANSVTPTFEVDGNAGAFVKTIDNYGAVENSGVLIGTNFTNYSDATVTNSNSSGYLGVLGYRYFTMEGGTVTSDGVLMAVTLEQTAGTITSNSGATVAASTLSVTGGTFSSAGTVVAPNFTLGETGDVSEGSATVEITGGTFVVPTEVDFDLALSVYLNGNSVYSTTFSEPITGTGATLNGGILKVMDGAQAEMAVSTTINSKVYVGGRLGIGDTIATISGTLSNDAGANDITVSTGTDKNSDNIATANSPIQQGELTFYDVDRTYNDIPGTAMPTSNLLALASPVTTGSTGYIQVGGSYSDPVGLDFESESTVVLTYDLYKDNTEDDPVIAFTAESGSGATISASGTLVMGVQSESGEGTTPADWYAIAKGYDYGSGTDTSNVWSKDKVIVVNQYGEQWSYAVGVYDPDDPPEEIADEDAKSDEKVVFLYLTSDEPEVGLCELGYVACNNIKTDIDAEDPTPGAEIVKDIVGNEDIPIEQRVGIMNSIANLPFAGGVIGTAMNGLNGAITDLFNHLTMDSDTFGAHGQMWPYDEFNNMWLDVHGTWYNQKHLSASGINRAGWRASAFGFILGYDRKLKERPVAIGGAFSFTGGNVKSTGNISYTKNKYQEYGLHLWSNYSPNEYLNVIGALHWMHNISDVSQKIGVSGTSGAFYNKAQGHMTTDWFALGVRFETSLSAGKFTFVPHIEPRYVYAKMRDFDTKIDGTSIWRTHAKGNSFFQIPLGIAARADFLTESGWTIRPNADVTITPQAGSTKLRTQLRNVYNAVDAVEGEFMGKFQTAVKLGVQFDRKNWTLGAKYGLVAGDRGKLDHGFILQLRLRY